MKYPSLVSFIVSQTLWQPKKPFRASLSESVINFSQSGVVCGYSLDREIQQFCGIQNNMDNHIERTLFLFMIQEASHQMMHYQATQSEFLSSPEKLLNTPPLLFEFSGVLSRTSHNTIETILGLHCHAIKK